MSVFASVCLSVCHAFEEETLLTSCFPLPYSFLTVEVYDMILMRG